MKYLSAIRYFCILIGASSLVLGLLPLVILMIIFWLIATYYDGKYNYFSN